MESFKVMNGGLSPREVEKRRQEFGWNEVLEQRPHWFFLFIKKFWGPSAWMIEIIAVLSFVLQKSADFSIALLLLFINAGLSFFEEYRASNVVEMLRQRLQIQARVFRDEKWNQIPARELVPGDMIRIRLGDIVPADLKIENGEVSVDQSVLTGESGGIQKGQGESLFAGSLVQRGEATCEVASIGSKTYFGRTIDLVQSARPRLHIEELVSKLVRVLFLVLGVLISGTLAIALSRGTPMGDILPLSLILLMSAVPVALPVMFTVSTAIAAKKLSGRGVLVTRLSAAEDAATMNILFVDKTGTITQNHLSVAGVEPAAAIETSELLSTAATASDEASHDPIDDAILIYCRDQNTNAGGQRLSFTPFSPETRRTESEFINLGVKAIATKGAVKEVLEWAQVEDKDIRVILQDAERAGLSGYRSIAVAKSLPNNSRKFLGLILLRDPPRPDSTELIQRLHKLGIRVKMLTGDAHSIAQNIATEVGMGAIAAWRKDYSMDWNKVDGLAQVFPETKYQAVALAQSHGEVVGMTGDGVNDAPALKKAEVGIAVDAATDSAKSAASVVLTTRGLSGIVDLVENGRAVYQRILTWIINKISRTVLKAGFVISAYFIYGQFVISAFGMILLVFMTDFAKISLSTDNVRISARPDSWKISPLITLGVFLGVVMILESLILLWIGRKYFEVSFQSTQIHTYSFLILLFLAIFSVISIRERHGFFSSRPSIWLLMALSADLLVGIFVGTFGISNLPAIGVGPTGALLLLSSLCALGLNDFLKVQFFQNII